MYTQDKANLLKQSKNKHFNQDDVYNIILFTTTQLSQINKIPIKMLN